jgi:hypothetical protein
MLFSLLTLLTSLSIAGLAAWFSIVGLISIFPAATVPILIMGIVLETGKLVTASWVYRNWKTATLLLKSYLIFAVIVLMLITSIGVFGFLSKAHLDQTAPADNSIAKVERLEQQIQQSQKQLDSANRIVLQLDGAVTTLTEYSKITGPSGAIATRKAQQQERQQLQQTIDDAQARISMLEDEKFALMVDVRKFEVEVGPIKYVAALLYGDEKADLESAVRFVILMLVVVLDPLAVLLLIAANQSLIAQRNSSKPIVDPVIPGSTVGSEDNNINTFATDTQADSVTDLEVLKVNPISQGWLGRGGK